MAMVKGIITRTFYTCIASAFAVSGVDADTRMPIMESVESEAYITVNANDMALAKRMVKSANKKAIPDTVSVEIVHEETRAMDLDMFYTMSEVVERAANGRITK